ncbi:hypothetical protein RRG08_054837 [Elysia crispata]|uniref:Uncharacterized protein n=1 Tax=Elysia crispata TaxID=231223 RepID=A0AAE1A788_9GAST|nr:hypothetical protein RRG08_054837 [Elysia crispata]
MILYTHRSFVFRANASNYRQDRLPLVALDQKSINICLWDSSPNLVFLAMFQTEKSHGLETDRRDYGLAPERYGYLLAALCFKMPRLAGSLIPLYPFTTPSHFLF